MSPEHEHVGPKHPAHEHVGPQHTAHVHVGRQHPEHERDHEERRHASLPPEATGARPGPGSVLLKVLSAAISGGLIVLLFMAIVPKMTEFGGVVEELKSMDVIVVVLLVVLAVLIRISAAAAFAVLVPGLSLWRSLVAKEASTAVSNVVPGPSGTASQFVILKSWNVGIERFTRATLAASVPQYVLILIAPGLLFVIWVLLGQPASQGGEHEWLYGLIAVAVSVVTLLIVSAVASSEKLAGRLGRLGQACVNPFRKLFHKAPLTGVDDKFVALRSDLFEELRERGGRLLFWVIANYVLNGVLLVICLWACGVTYSELSLSLGLMLYSLGRIATIIQITPGGVGVVEIAYTTIYVAVLGESANDSVVAGVLVYRALTYLLPIVTGAFAYVIWRLMRRAEKREEAVAEAT
jgi:uncharacterized protein (TIRG00374 family)